MKRFPTMILAVLLVAPAWAETLTAARMVRANTVISSEDLALSPASTPGALGGGADIVGLEARVTLYPGLPIRPEHVGPAALVERNQPVTLVFRRGGLLIVAEARALSRGAAGDFVRVMNLASRTTVTGRVQPDGSVAVSPAESLR